MPTNIPVGEALLSANDQVAAENQAVLDAAGILGLNLMASPGAGKTSLILATADHLGASVAISVIEGDLASSIDADTIASRGLPVALINTGGNCHLDAPMIRSAMDRIPLDRTRLLLVENVGNLVCPANFLLGTHANVVVASVTEGHDKPYKYPGMFAAADIVLLNKSDLSEVFAFDLDYFRHGVTLVNPDIPVVPISCRTGSGLAAWCDWLRTQLGDE
jgi:hydrogenase nickel incorporation protein HypB